MVTAEDLTRLVEQARSSGARRSWGTPVPTTGSTTHFAVLVKPELLAGAAAGDVLRGVGDVLTAQGVSVGRGVAETAAGFLSRGRLMRHYPRLHRVAAGGATELCAEAVGELDRFVARHGLDRSAAVGAFEAFVLEPDLDAAGLDERVRAAGITKLGPGSYVAPAELGGRTRALLNGFLPALQAGYAAPDALVAVLECASEREVADLRHNLLGPLHPGEAPAGTLRGLAASLQERTGGPPLSEGRNGIHLSAGHLEGMFQVWHYFGAADGQDLSDTAFGQAACRRGLESRSLGALALDPNVPDGRGAQLSPFGRTENLTLAEVLDRTADWIAGSRRVAA